MQLKFYTIVQAKSVFPQLTVSNLQGMNSCQKKTIIMRILNELVFVIDSALFAEIFLSLT